VQLIAGNQYRLTIAGVNHSLAMKPDGSLWAWGDNSNGEIGVGSVAPYYYPAQVPGISSAQSASAGYNFSVVLKSDGTVWACGVNSYGQIGDGTTTQRASLVQVSGLTGVTAISAILESFLGVSRPFGATSRDFLEFPLSVAPLLDCGFPIFIVHQDSASVRFILFAFAPIT
jgi:hypothetical protein